MKTYRSFGALARALSRTVAELPNTYSAAMRAGALAVQDDAKERIGHYQAAWAALAPSTVAEKTRLGYAGGPIPGGDGGDNPLLRTGETRDSIGCWSSQHEFIVGSTSDILKFQEFGTATIPPRPVLGPAMMHTMPFAVKVLGRAVAATLRNEP